MLCDRKRTAQLFGFDHRLEIYVPPAKRRWGYYVLPILFGGLGLWAALEIVLINRAAPLWAKPAPAPLGKEIGAVVGAVVVFAVAGYIHGIVGPWPFG